MIKITYGLQYVQSAPTEKKISTLIMEAFLSKCPVETQQIIKESGIDFGTLLQLSNDDVMDLLRDSPFIERVKLRKLIQSFAGNTNKVEPTPGPSSVSSPDITVVSSPGVTAVSSPVPGSVSKAENQLTPERKQLGKKWTPEHKRFHTILKDAAMSAHIWQKSPTLENIPGKKREAFFLRIRHFTEMKDVKDQILWNKLGMCLQNRRKYIHDKAKGKRKDKSKQSPTRVKSRHTQFQSPTKRSYSNQSMLNKSPIARKSRQSPAGKTNKSPNARKSMQSPAAKTNKSPIARKTRQSPAAKSNKSSNVRKSLQSPSAKSKQVEITEKEIELGSRVNFLDKSETKLGIATLISYKDQVFVELSFIKSISENIDCDLYDSTKTVADLKPKDIFLWKMSRLAKLIPGSGTTKLNKKNTSGGHGAARQILKDFDDHVSAEEQSGDLEDGPNMDTSYQKKKLSDKTCSIQENREAELVIMEWNAGHVFLGILTNGKEGRSVISCKKPIIQIMVMDPSIFKMLYTDELTPLMLFPNTKDIEFHPDKDFLIWKPERKFYSITGQKSYKISITDNEAFQNNLTAAVARYLE